MAFDPNAEPCHSCGREVDECVCGLSPGLPDDTYLVNEDDNEQFYEWDPTEEVLEETSNDSVGYE